MDKFGIVLAGGGSKGAYQIGAWRALKDLGIIDKVSGYSGTSIGALNAGLFVQGDLEAAEQMWRNVSKEQMMNLKIKERSKIDLNTRFKDLRNQLEVSEQKIKDRIKNFQLEFDIDGKALIEKLKNIPQIDANPDLSRIAERIKNINVTGAYSREGLKHVMNQTADFKLISRSEIEWYSACLELPSFNVEYFKMNGLTVNEMEKVLLATSAIPLIYDPVIINHKRYIDGGASKYGDNIPIKPLYDAGFNKIIVIHLNSRADIDEDLYPNADIIQIKPGKDIGTFISGTMDFSQEGIRKRMENGYKDTINLTKTFKVHSFVD